MVIGTHPLWLARFSGVLSCFGFRFAICAFTRATAGYFLDYLILCVDTKKFFLACGRDSFVTSVRSQKRASALDFVLACG